MKYLSYLLLFLLSLSLNVESAHLESLELVAATTSTAAIAIIHPEVTIKRACVIGTNSYTVNYTYNPAGPSTIPAIEGAKCHYSAFITVYNQKNVQISKGWFGQVIPDGGCFEDIPEEMVRLALEQRRSDVQTWAKEKLEELNGTNNWKITNVTINTNSVYGNKIDTGVYTVTNYSVSITTNLLILTNYNFKITTNLLTFTNNIVLTNKPINPPLTNILITNRVATNKLTTITNTIKK